MVGLSPNSLMRLREADYSFGDLANRSLEDDHLYIKPVVQQSSHKKSAKALPQLEIEKIQKEAKVSEFDFGIPSFIGESLCQGDENEGFKQFDSSIHAIDSVRGCGKTPRQHVLSPIAMNNSNLQSARSYADSNVSPTKNFCNMIEEKEKRYFESNKKAKKMLEVAETESYVATKPDETVQTNQTNQASTGKLFKSKEQLMNEALLRGIARLMIAEKKRNALKNENLPIQLTKQAFGMTSLAGNNNSGKPTSKRLA